jgi:hypothetical protein
LPLILCICFALAAADRGAKGNVVVEGGSDDFGDVVDGFLTKFVARVWKDEEIFRIPC